MKKLLTYLILPLVLVACGSEEANNDVETEDTPVSLLDMDDQDQNKSFEFEPDETDLAANFDTIYLGGELFYVVQGDLLLRPKEALKHWFAVHEYHTEGHSDRKLVGERRNGKVVKWPSPENIRFAVVKSSFSSTAEYDSIVKYFTTATKDWEGICNVKFTYEKSLDTDLKYGDNPANLDFVVQYEGAVYRAPLASAFFPYNSKKDRVVRIFDRFMRTSASKTGIMRHEIGHILGFRHEHVRDGAPLTCNKMENDMEYLLPITDYDGLSVMHYFCGGAGTRHLNFSAKDSLGARYFYPKE